MNIIGVGTNKKIIDLFNMMKSENLILQPSFQRRLVWNNLHKENFINTILQGLPFPEVYFCDGEIDLENQKSTTLVVDGQQRLSTIYEYITGSEKLVLKSIPKFNELSAVSQTNFFDYIVVVRDIGRRTDEEIKEIFNRINSVQYALNAMEINNALYEGAYITTAKYILENSNLQELEVFNDGDINRMKDLEFILLVMASIDQKGYFTSDNEVEAFIKLFDNEYPNSEIITKAIIDTISKIKQLKLAPDSIWFRKTGFFTLIVEIAKMNIGSTVPQKSDLFRILNKFEDLVLRNKNKSTENNEYAEFYKFMFQGTASRKGRQRRGEILSTFIQTDKK